MKLFITVLLCLLSLPSFAKPPHKNKETLGEQRVAVILLDYLNDGKTKSIAEVEEAIFTGEYSINKFYQEASYGKTSLTGKVFGWYSMKGTEGCYLDNELLFKKIRKDVNLKKYDRFLVLYNQSMDACMYNGLGQSTHGKEAFKTPVGPINVSVSHVWASFHLGRIYLPFGPRAHITSTVTAHELGHAFGIYGHANIFDCGKETLTLNSEGCTQSAISDMHSIMGGEGFFRSSLHFNACHKEELNWFQNSEIKTIDVSQLTEPVEFDLLPYEKPGKGFLTAKIELQNPISVTDKVKMRNLFLEFRTETGFDRGLTDLVNDIFKKYDSVTFSESFYPVEKKVDINGVIIRGGFYNEGRCTTTYLLDSKPDSLRYSAEEYGLYDSIDGMLTMGQKFVDPNNGIQISVVSVVPNQIIRVRVEKIR